MEDGAVSEWLASQDVFTPQSTCKRENIIIIITNTTTALSQTNDLFIAVVNRISVLICSFDV